MVISPNFHNRIIFFTIALAMFMESLDSNIINTAIPAMAQSFQVNPIDLKIALISYLLSLAIFIPISGWIADKFGAKKVFIFALAIFTLSSLWCGFSHSLKELVFARILQGLGGSLSLPVGRLIIVRTVGRSEYVAAMNRVATVASLGMMLGPVLGGFITHYFSWHWIFFINIPVGIFAILMARYFLITTIPQPVPALDKLGFVLFGSSLAGFTFGLSAFSETYITDKWALIIISSSFLLFLFYLWHSYRHPHPIVNLKLFQLRTFRVSALGNLFSRLCFNGIPFLLPLLLQVVIGYPAQISGLLLAPAAIGVLLAKRVSLFFLHIFGYKLLLIANTILLGLSVSAFTTVTEHTSFYHLGALTLVFGFLSAVQYACLNSLCFAQVSSEDYSGVTSFMSTLQQLAQSFGVAVAALFVRFFSLEGSHNFTLIMPAFHDTFILFGIISILLILIFVQLDPRDGHQMIDHHS
jgi:EmrB/QacA subfamily drug resistance transporter